MEPIGNEEEEKKMIVTQVSVGGFSRHLTAEELSEFLENEIGVVLRCRLKNSCTPPYSYPLFGVASIKNVQRTDNYEKVEPHAFVHFAIPEAVTRALNAAGCDELVLNGKPLKVSLGPESPFFINKRRRNTKPFKFCKVHVQIGTLFSEHEFWVGWKAPASGVDMVVDRFDNTCRILFTEMTAFSLNGTEESAVIKCDFMLEFPVTQIIEIKQAKDLSSLIVIFQLSSSPFLFYRTADDDIHVTAPFELLDDDDPWIRTTDFTPHGAIGRCNSCKISLSPRYGSMLEEAMSYLRDRQIPIIFLEEQLMVQDEPKPDYSMPISNPFFHFQYKEEICFEIMFLVNAAMHKGIFNQHHLSEEFFELIRSLRRELSVAALRHMCSYRRPVVDVCKKLKHVQEWILKNPYSLAGVRSPDDSVEVRKLVITPTKAYCLPPVVELSNRVLRKYKEVADRFLRVTFMDEDMQRLFPNVLRYYAAPLIAKEVASKSFSQKTSVFRRVATIMRSGFRLCGRKYTFLAFSQNQLRDHSAWFFAEDDNIKVSDIRSWMGDFTDRNVAKYAARMGLCFSSTYATVEVPLDEVNSKLPDIKRNGYDFSDGIGTITPDLAMEVAEKLQLTANPPSAYQIRFAGCKGVIACWPGKGDGIRLSLRQSMNKFVSGHNILEVASWTRFQPGFLNRQIITLLSALDVPDDVFSRMQDSMVCKLDQMLENTDMAFEILTLSCSEEGNTAAMMLAAGFKPQREPHLRSMLSSVRVAQLTDLLEKARIFVPSGRWLMGCLDELGVLEYGQCFIQVSTPSLENRFSKHGPEFSESMRNVRVIKGTVVIAKNPCLHPGDIRILEAVDAPGLRHLVDCLVFPQRGERPHTNEASGSDLDGDLYFVTWDEILIPPSKRSWLPMKYDPPEAKKLPHKVKNSDIINFFTESMLRMDLGTICNAHVVHSDQSEHGAMDEKCIKLAELAAIAVDFPKTGKIETMPAALKPKVYPDFMGKPDFQSYKSNKILGKLYRKVKDASDGEIPYDMDLKVPKLSTPQDIPYDMDLEVPGSENFILDAWNSKCSYDRQLQALLGQYKVNTEAEVVSGHIWSFYTNNKHGNVKEKLINAYHALKKEFKCSFMNLGLDFEQSSDKDKNSVYEQKASAWYQVTYHPRWVKKSLETKGGALTMLSFAWIPVEYLVRVKIRSQATESVDPSKPINSLAHYLATRI